MWNAVKGILEILSLAWGSLKSKPPMPEPVDTKEAKDLVKPVEKK